MTEKKNLMRLADVIEKCKISKTTIWRKVKNGEFPKAKVVGGLSFWYEKDIDDWIEKSMNKAA